MFKPKFKKQNNDFIFSNLRNRCRTSIIMTVIFIFSVFTVYASPIPKQITIRNGESIIEVITSSSTVEDVLTEQGIDVSEDDEVVPALNSSLYDKMTISVSRVKRVNLECDGYNVVYHTTAETYREFLAEEKIVISDEDIINVNLDDKLKDKDKISISRVTSYICEVDETIPYTSTTVYDDTLPVGYSAITQSGSNGTKKVCYKVSYVDGVEKSSEYVGEYVVTEPVNEVTTIGTYENVATYGDHTISYQKVLTCQATAYDLSFASTGKHPGQPGYGITASGTYAKMGTVAVDPRVIPLGTKMYIVSTDGSVVYGYCTAEDTGGAIKGNKVDLFYNTTSECLQFGRRSVYVYIL